MPVQPKQIECLPDVLTTKTRKVREINGKTRDLAKEMIVTMRANGGVGLAAPQIGVPLRMAVYQLPEDSEPTVLVNPYIVRKKGDQLCEGEGCLSIVGFRGTTLRSSDVRVRAYDLDGKEIKVRGKNLLAQVLEHEIDHLNGVLLFERLIGGMRRES